MRCILCGKPKKPHQLRNDICLACMRLKKLEPADPTEYPETITEVKTMNKSGLVGLAGSLKVSIKGIKAELVNRIIKKLKLKPLR